MFQLLLVCVCCLVFAFHTYFHALKAYYFPRNSFPWFLWRYIVCVKMIEHVLRTACVWVSINNFPLVSDNYLHYSLTNSICTLCLFFGFPGLLCSYDVFHLLLKDPQRPPYLLPSVFLVLFCFLQRSWLLHRYILEIGWHSELGLREYNDNLATFLSILQIYRFTHASGRSLYSIAPGNRRIIYLVFYLFSSN